MVAILCLSLHPLLPIPDHDGSISVPVPGHSMHPVCPCLPCHPVTINYGTATLSAHLTTPANIVHLTLVPNSTQSPSASPLPPNDINQEAHQSLAPPSTSMSQLADGFYCTVTKLTNFHWPSPNNLQVIASFY